MQPLHHQPRYLLVGEGNFSFSVSLYEERGCKIHITATCYDSEESVCGQIFTRSNISFLRNKGAEVYFSVDCTKLKEHFLPAVKNFDRIYFNFPHCGKKAGIKKNRELLAKFFCSCADVLAKKGEIYVALCKGQGGTPADQPVREWHNSWQAVAMAAEAGFLLSGIHPFNTRDVGRYKCTGYRSQDKSFSTEGAFNHIFTRSLPFLNPSPFICQVELEGGIVSCQVPEIFLDKINRSFLDMNSTHPVRTINEKLIDELHKSFPVQKVNSLLPLLYGVSSDSSSPLDTFWMVPVAKRPCRLEPVVTKPADATDTFVFPGISNWEGTDWENDLSWILGQYYLRPSLLVFLPSIVQQTVFCPGTLVALSGLAFQQRKPSVLTPPIFHEAAFVCVVNRHSEDAQLLVESLTNALSYLLQLSGFQLGCMRKEPETRQQNSSVTPEIFLHKPKYFISVSGKAFDSDTKELCVGTVHVVPWQPLHANQDIVCASLNLDLLAMCVCGVSDWRMLWTFDERFGEQFAGGRLGPFQSFSLHPPSYTHDISFWVPEPETFSETQFHAIASCVSFNTVVSVQLLDCFRHPATGKTSLCYRLTYQSCDKALSGQQVAAMQMKLRKEIERHLLVTVR